MLEQKQNANILGKYDLHTLTYYWQRRLKKVYTTFGHYPKSLISAVQSAKSAGFVIISNKKLEQKDAMPDIVKMLPNVNSSKIIEAVSEGRIVRLEYWPEALDAEIYYDGTIPKPATSKGILFKAKFLIPHIWLFPWRELSWEFASVHTDGAYWFNALNTLLPVQNSNLLAGPDNEPYIISVGLYYRYELSIVADGPRRVRPYELIVLLDKEVPTVLGLEMLIPYKRNGELEENMKELLLYSSCYGEHVPVVWDQDEITFRVKFLGRGQIDSSPLIMTFLEYPFGVGTDYYMLVVMARKGSGKSRLIERIKESTKDILLIDSDDYGKMLFAAVLTGLLKFNVDHLELVEGVPSEQVFTFMCRFLQSDDTNQFHSYFEEYAKNYYLMWKETNKKTNFSSDIYLTKAVDSMIRTFDDDYFNAFYTSVITNPSFGTAIWGQALTRVAKADNKTAIIVFSHSINDTKIGFEPTQVVEMTTWYNPSLALYGRGKDHGASDDFEFANVILSHYYAQRMGQHVKVSGSDILSALGISPAVSGHRVLNLVAAFHHPKE